MTRRLSRLALLFAFITAGLGLGFGPELRADDPAPKPAEKGQDSEVGKSFKVPYRLTDTNHFLVRVRINGKGPFNFLVDTGAPALYVATETAKTIGLKPPEDSFWTPVDRLDFEGGARLSGLKARVEDPFQLIGMNALGLPGASIDGILGFTMLARFKMEIDPTSDRMTWTLLDFKPQDPPVPERGPGDRAPAEMQAMNALGPIAKFAAAFVGKQPEEELVLRGFLGIELEEKGDALEASKVLPGSPAEEAGVKAGDTLLKIGKATLEGLKSARLAAVKIEPGDKVMLTLKRAGENEPVEVEVVAGEGL